MFLFFSAGLKETISVPLEQHQRRICRLNCGFFFALACFSIMLNSCWQRNNRFGDGYMPGPELAVAPMHRICKKAGADRVSESAAKELAKVLDDMGVKIAREAMDYAVHAGRKTIKSEDVEIAARKVLGK